MPAAVVSHRHDATAGSYRHHLQGGVALKGQALEQIKKEKSLKLRRVALHRFVSLGFAFEMAGGLEVKVNAVPVRMGGKGGRRQ